MARRFFLISAGLLCLAITYHLGASNATAQAPGNPIVGMDGGGGLVVVVTADGTLYANEGSFATPFRIVGHVFGGPTPVRGESWGDVKARYRR